METKRIRYFLEIVRMQSIGKAAKKLGVNQSVLSKNLKSMEEELGCQLYIHYDKTFRLTHVGESVCRYFQRMITIFDAMKDDLFAMQNDPKGKLTLVSSAGVVHFLLMDSLPGFMEENKNISLSFVTNDLAQELGVDSDISIGPKITSPGIISLPFHTYSLKMYASREYLEKHGTPQKPQDLDHHSLVAYSHEARSNMMDFDWHLRYGSPNGVPRQPTLEVTSSYALKKAAEMGLGIVTFSKFIMDRDHPNLVEIFPNEMIDVSLYFSYRKEQENFWALEKYRDYLFNYMKKERAKEIE